MAVSVGTLQGAQLTKSHNKVNVQNMDNIWEKKAYMRLLLIVFQHIFYKTKFKISV